MAGNRCGSLPLAFLSSSRVGRFEETPYRAHTKDEGDSRQEKKKKKGNSTCAKNWAISTLDAVKNITQSLDRRID